MSLPPLFFYAIGTLLIVFGALRVVFLGRRRAGRELTEDTPQRAKLRRYHTTWGTIFVLAGAVLILLTSGVIGPGSR
jgi:hypothetical protein